DPENARTGAGAFEGAIFGLVGLVIAFSFSGALQRWDHRRELMVQEVNAIGTAWLRIDLLPSDAQPLLRELFRRYVDSRLESYGSIRDPAAGPVAFARSNALQGEIWSAAVRACAGPELERTRILVLPALNEMIDVAGAQFMALQAHPPAEIYELLVALVLASALMAGIATAGARQRSWAHLVLFSLSMAVVLFVVIDLEYPRAGFIRIDAIDQALVELRHSMER
ncbi:MAG TPA: DUF4239 domain-containing protein, partial [Myxococcota bacterium]|nr:DUF4239 domain-containing protein [Myxococcota bacterium]